MGGAGAKHYDIILYVYVIRALKGLNGLMRYHEVTATNVSGDDMCLAFFVL